jgi:hypothetical protein
MSWYGSDPRLCKASFCKVLVFPCTSDSEKSENYDSDPDLSRKAEKPSAMPLVKLQVSVWDALYSRLCGEIMRLDDLAARVLLCPAHRKDKHIFTHGLVMIVITRDERKHACKHECKNVEMCFHWCMRWYFYVCQSLLIYLIYGCVCVRLDPPKRKFQHTRPAATRADYCKCLTLTWMNLQNGGGIRQMLLGRIDPWPDELRGEETNAGSVDTVWQVE